MCFILTNSFVTRVAAFGATGTGRHDREHENNGQAKRLILSRMLGCILARLWEGRCSLQLLPKLRCIVNWQVYNICLHLGVFERNLCPWAQGRIEVRSEYRRHGTNKLVS